jgi:hypothetical protein
MYCSYCGASVEEGARFCAECGSVVRVDPPYQPEVTYAGSQANFLQEQQFAAIGSNLSSKKKKGTKKFFFLGAGCTVAVAGVLVFVMIFTGVISLNGANGAKIEGSGFSSAKEAALAYAEGFANQDVGKMLSACSVESTIDNFDSVEYIKYTRSFYSSISKNYFNVTNSENILGELNINQRKRGLEGQILMSYKLIAAPWLWEYWLNDEGEIWTRLIENETELNDLMADLNDAEDSEDLKQIKIISTEEPQVYSDAYDEEANQKILREQAKIFGAERIEDIVVNLEVNGEPYLMALEMAKYGDKWYVLWQGGNITELLSWNSLSRDNGFGPTKLLQNS